MALAPLLYGHMNNSHRPIELIWTKKNGLQWQELWHKSTPTMVLCSIQNTMIHAKLQPSPRDEGCALDTNWFDMENWCLAKINEYRDMEIICSKD